VRVGATGNVYLLIDQKDGVRVLETDSTATNILNQAQVGAQGDVGLAMALDPAGNVYVTGTTTSGALMATGGSAFTAASGTATNSFVAKFGASLGSPIFVTFCGGGSMDASSIAATSDAVFITGTIYLPNGTVPVTAAGIIQTPAFGSQWNGFAEKFSASGSSLLYATYLSGTGGNTTLAAIVADASDDAYIAGTTTAPGYPTIAALVPNQLVTTALGTTSGFLTKLTPAGDGITFSTFIPGAGTSSLAIDSAAGNLLLTGSISLGQFPVASVATPLTAIGYQVLVRMTLDGQTVLGSTVLAPGTQSFVATGAAGTAWVDGSFVSGLPLLPLTPLSTIGNSFAVRVNAANLVDQTARFGGIASSNPNSASAPVALTSVAIDASGNALVGGSFAPSASQGLLATETFDLPLNDAPTAAFPSAVRGAVLPVSACNGSLCPGAAAYLSKLTIPASAAAAMASLALSVDDSPNLTLRNLGSAQATGVGISVSGGFTQATNCGATLAAGGECSIALTGTGPGSITVSAANSTAQTQALPALASGVVHLPVVFSPKELDFGVVSSASGAVTRTVTVTNLTQQSQSFASQWDIGSRTTLPYTFAQTATDCTLAGNNFLLAPGGVCHITIGLTASNSAANDGAIQQNWLIGARDVQMTAYGQAAALSLSAPEIDFGTQYTGGLRPARYLYLSNNSTVSYSHAAVTLPASSPFTVTDRCPSTLEPQTVCQLQLAYQNAHTPAADADTLSLDQGLTALVTGRSLPQPVANGASVNPNLSVSSTSINFANAVVVTGVSSATETLTIGNTGTAAFTLSLILSGDFTDSTNCGATLAGGGSCNVVFTFVPSQPGTRQGLLAVTAGAGTTPAYVALSGVGTGILSPANNGTLNFGGVIAGEPTVEWFKITQPFTSFTVATASTTLGAPYTAIIVEDIGYGHGQPASSAFTTSATGTCTNCWVGVQFTPPATGLETGTLTISSAAAGSPYVLSLTGNGLPLTGLLLTPVVQEFGPVAVNSVSATELFAVTNLVAGGGSITVATPAVTGDFSVSNAVSGGTLCGGALAYTASCFVQIGFSPTAAGPRTGTLTVQAGSSTATAALTGYGSADPGISLTPNALVFNNVPGSSSTQQTVTLSNTSTTAEQIGAVVATTTSSSATSFSASSNCGTLNAGANCAISVTFTPATAQAAGTLTIPVTSTIGGAPVLSNYAVPLTGAYTTEDEGLEIVAEDAEYGPQATGASGVTRQFTIDNLTAKPLSLSIALPRQFVLSGAPCAGLAPNASCNFSVAFLPLDNGDLTGTLFAEATPTDGSATLNGLSYVEGYGLGGGTLTVTGGLQPGEVLSFGQVASGQSVQKILTLTNSSPTATLIIRRITSEWPFLSTTTCGTTLAPAAYCTVTLSYTPTNQVAAGSSPPSTTADSGELVIESDAVSSPDLIDLTGSSTPVYVTSPTNVAPLATLIPSQSSLTFANTMVGNVSAPQTVTLDNTGTATLNILGLQTTPDYTVSSNCASIVPGASCTLTVTFTPQNSTQQGSGSGMRASAIEVSSNAATSLEFISVAGVSSPSSLTIAQSSLNFGTVLVGANLSLPLQLTNTGASAITFGILSATTNLSAAAGDYTVAAGNCPQPGLALAAGTSCTVQVGFAPTQSGTLTGTLSIASSASTLPLTVALTGVGVQSHMQILPASLSFGSIAVNSPANLSLTLFNNGTAPITGVTLSATGDYAITVPCPVSTLAPGGSCGVTVTFTPSKTGADNGTLTVTSSDATSPDAVPLTGTGFVSGTFTLSVGGGTSASATVASGTPASYSLTVTPGNNFSGTVVLNCTPIAAAEYATCSLQPSSVTLSGAAQNAVATLNTVTEISANSLPARPGSHRRSLGETALCLLFPALVFSWKARSSRHKARWRDGAIAWAIFSAILLLSASGCGGNSVNSNLRFSPPGSYQYQVTASSVSGVVQITQTVTLNLTVQ
jgi:trimeric autotransporter adhesin